MNRELYIKDAGGTFVRLGVVQHAYSVGYSVTGHLSALFVETAFRDRPALDMLIQSPETVTALSETPSPVTI